MDDDRLHTCHAECPCHTGGEPTPDFLPIEGSLMPGLSALARQRRGDADELNRTQAQEETDG